MILMVRVIAIGVVMHGDKNGDGDSDGYGSSC